MTYKAATKLHNGDEVIRKSDNVPLRVISTVVHSKLVWKIGRLHPFVIITATEPNNNLVNIDHLFVY